MEAVRIKEDGDGLTLAAKVRNPGDVVPVRDIPEAVMDRIRKGWVGGVEIVDVPAEAFEKPEPPSLPVADETHRVQASNVQLEEAPPPEPVMTETATMQEFPKDSKGRWVCGGTKADGGMCMMVMGEPGKRCRHHKDQV